MKNRKQQTEDWAIRGILIVVVIITILMGIMR